MNGDAFSNLSTEDKRAMTACRRALQSCAISYTVAMDDPAANVRLVSAALALAAATLRAGDGHDSAQARNLERLSVELTGQENLDAIAELSAKLSLHGKFAVHPGDSDQ